MTGGSRKGYAERIVARARELHESDAFEAAPAVVEHVSTAEQALAETRAENRGARRMTAGFAVVLAFVLLASVSLSSEGLALYSLLDVADCAALWFRMYVVPLFDTTQVGTANAILEEFEQVHGELLYSDVTYYATFTALAALCGVMLAVAGCLFQTAFRNPLATPVSLGVSDGVTIGCIIYSMLGFSTVEANSGLYLALVYGLGAATVAVVLLLSRGLSGGARCNVLDMLLVGTVVAQLVGGIGTYIQTFVMDDAQWQIFYDVQMANNALNSSLIVGVTAVVAIVTIVVALVLRFRLNMVAFSEDEGRLAGVRIGALRGAALVVGSAMVLAAYAAFGPVSVVSLAVPFAVRYLMPSEFRWQLLGNCLLGSIFLVVCVLVQRCVASVALVMPTSLVTNLLIVPVFIWVVAFGKGGWK